MVPANSWRRAEILEDGFPEFSKNAVRLLDKIISNTNADIVLTISYKRNYSLKEWKKIFERRNIIVKKITRLSENINHSNQKDELLNWFSAEHISEKFIIIDDNKSLNDLPGFLKNKLVQTIGSVGLTDYLADEALKIINNLEYQIAK
jgi:16S rRNA C1402 (ribose-2'-O) methylase RsmI